MEQQHLNLKLLKFCKEGNIEAVEQALKEGAEINTTDDFGDTPLHWASLGGHLAIVTFLLEKNAEINVKNSKGDTALSYASPWGYTEMVALLKAHGATR